MGPVVCMVFVTALISFGVGKTTREYNNKHSHQQTGSELNTYSDNADPPEWIDPFDIGIKLPSEVVPPKPGWVDPFVMPGEESHFTDLLVLSDVEKHVLAKRLSNCEFFAKRFTNLFLNAVLKSQDFQKYSPISVNIINLEFLITAEEMKNLHDFGRSTKDANIEKVSDAFTNIFQNSKATSKSSFSNLHNILTWIQNKLIRLIQSPEWTVASSIALLLFLTLWFAWSHSYRFAMFTFFLTIFLCGFGFTWIRMIEEKEVERFAKIEQHGHVPYHCGRNEMRWFEHMYYRMFGEDCVKFYQTRDIRPVIQVSPTDALAETISSMIVNPAKNIGNAYGSFISSVTNSVSWWLKPIAIVLGAFLPVAFLIILLTFLFNYNLSLSITGFRIYPSWFNAKVDSLSGHNEKYVEDVSIKEVQRKSSYEEVMNNSSEPVFIMNWKGVQKLASSTILKEGNDELQEKPKEDITLVRTNEVSDVKIIQQSSDTIGFLQDNCRKRSVNVSLNDKLPLDSIENSNQSESNLSEEPTSSSQRKPDAASSLESKDKIV